MKLGFNKLATVALLGIAAFSRNKFNSVSDKESSSISALIVEDLNSMIHVSHSKRTKFDEVDNTYISSEELRFDWYSNNSDEEHHQVIVNPKSGEWYSVPCKGHEITLSQFISNEEVDVTMFDNACAYRWTNPNHSSEQSPDQNK